MIRFNSRYRILSAKRRPSSVNFVLQSVNDDRTEVSCSIDWIFIRALKKQLPCLKTIHFNAFSGFVTLSKCTKTLWSLQLYNHGNLGVAIPEEKLIKLLDLLERDHDGKMDQI